jgi:hypothetical protein
MAIHMYAIRDGKVLEDAVMTDPFAVMQLGICVKCLNNREEERSIPGC